MSEDEEAIALTPYRFSFELRNDSIRGRGVFTNEPLGRNTLIEISPILFFNAAEYEEHGKYTILDHYTYCWKDGFALALGLGSMFNHDNSPNVGFIRDIPNKLIRYVTLRPIEKGEELCISYGQHLWFEDSQQSQQPEASDEEPLPFVDTSDDDEQ
ncbi:SET domain-containing protein 7 [Choanephora cucurbitarum]|uniref:SET domain-containing protein 7 n=1 Tax=Choanephora cucurbitarum TaxID=101091 RepID=A0A1C7NMQ0_9FUNG|nr:SET domain-containing protein 7 [Choanephora cucurbitarum]